MMGLRTDEGVGWSDLAALDLTSHSPAVLELAEIGLVSPDANRLRATPEGRRMLDSVIRKLVLD
jgi:oxygen-independent coproporphyrinogen-3 oxidase